LGLDGPRKRGQRGPRELYEKIKEEWDRLNERTIGHIPPPTPLLSTSVPKALPRTGVFELGGPKFKDAFKSNFSDLGAFRFIPLQVV
jgi:hypothetical protein